MTDNIKAAILVGLYAVGFILGIGQDMLENPEYKFRRMFGNAILHGGATMAAGLLLIWLPDTDLLVLFGLAGLIGALGVSWIKLRLTKYLKEKE